MVHLKKNNKNVDSGLDSKPPPLYGPSLSKCFFFAVSLRMATGVFQEAGSSNLWLGYLRWPVQGKCLNIIRARSDQQ